MSESIPIPSQAMQIAQKMKAGQKLQQLQLENILLKHLVATIDPEHDYLMDLDKMSLTKVKRDEHSTGKETSGGEIGNPGGEARRAALKNMRPVGPATPKETGEGI